MGTAHCPIGSSESYLLEQLQFGADQARNLFRCWWNTEVRVFHGVLVAVYAFSLHRNEEVVACPATLQGAVTVHITRDPHNVGMVVRQQFNSSAALSGRHLNIIDAWGLLFGYSDA